MASEGPYQGVIGFSQGAALAATLMIKQGQSNAVHSPFQCAIVLCGGMPYDPAALEGGRAVLLDDKPDAPDIHVPTAHILGEKDDALATSLALVEQFDPRSLKLYMHAGGHDVPRDIQAVRRMISVIQEVLHLASHAQ
jgi:predicted esterase